MAPQKKRTPRPQPLRGQAKAAAALFKQQREDTPHVQEPSASSSAAQPDAAAATDTVVQPPTVTTDADASQEHPGVMRTRVTTMDSGDDDGALDDALSAVTTMETLMMNSGEHLESLRMNYPTVEVIPACEQEDSEDDDDDDDASPEPADDAGTGFIADVAGVPAEEKIANDEQIVFFDAQANDNGESFASDFVSNLQNPIPKKRQLMREKSNTRMNDLSDIENDETDNTEEMINDIFGASDDKQESGKVAHTPPI